jgi:hypothetical protein
VIPGLVADEILQKGPDDIAAKALQRTGLFTSVPAPEIDPSVGLWNLGRVSKSRMRYVVKSARPDPWGARPGNWPGLPDSARKLK